MPGAVSCLLTPGFLAFLIGCALPSLVIAYTDARWRLVPDLVTLPVLLAGLASAPLQGRLLEAFLGAALGFGLFLLPAVKGWAGGGDLKCAAALGAWLGPAGLARLLAASFCLGALWAAAAKLKKRELGAWLSFLLKGLWLRAFCGVRGAVYIGDVESNPGDGVPFGTCMAAALWALWLETMIP